MRGPNGRSRMIDRLTADIDPAAIRANVAHLAQRAGRAQIAVDVSVDGWGHGAVDTARAAEGVDAAVVVDRIDEAERLRAAGIAGRLLLTGALFGEGWSRAAAAGAEVLVWGVEGIAAAAAAPGPPLAVHLLVDTGLGPPGARIEGLGPLVDAATHAVEVGGIHVVGVMADPAASVQTTGEHAPFLREQFVRLRAAAATVAGALPGVGLGGADAASLLRDADTAGDLVRVGEAAYGVCPFGGRAADHRLRPAMAIHAPVAAVSVVRSRESVGLGRAWRAARGAVVAVLQVGTGDGYPWGAVGRASALVGGVARPVVGAVGYHAVAVDLGPEGRASIGDPAVLIGSAGAACIEAVDLVDGPEGALTTLGSLGARAQRRVL